jgi:uncharacterized protein YcnI
MSRTTRRLSAAFLATALVAVAAPASAHVTVSSDDASPGGFGVATLRVPNESDTAATTKLTVTLPTEAPFAFVSAQAKPGWTVDTTTEKLDEPVKTGDFDVTEVTTSITWTATGDGIAPGEYDTFGLSGGPFPDADLTLPTVQTYDDGEVAAWDQEQTGDTEPERPAPVLALTGSASDQGHAHGDASSDDATAASAEVDESSTDGVALVIAIAAAVLAAAALLVSVRQNRRRA